MKVSRSDTWKRPVFTALAAAALVSRPAYTADPKVLDGGDPADAAAPEEAASTDATAPNPEVESLRRTAREVRELISGQLDPEIMPQSLFDVPLLDNEAINVEAARLAALTRQIDESAAQTRSAAGRRLSRAKPPARAGGPLEAGLRSIDPGLWAVRIDLDRARLSFYALPSDRRRDIVGIHGERQAEAARARADRPLSEAEQRVREAEAERQKALEDARLAHSEAERLVAQEYGRLLGIERAQTAFEATLNEEREELAVQREVTVGWQRRAREARKNGSSNLEDIDTTYDDLRKALQRARNSLSRALDEVKGDSSAVPSAGPDPLQDLDVDVDASKTKAQRARVEAEANRLRLEERRLREDRASHLLDDIDKLNQERLALLDFLSPAKRDALTGFTAAGLDQVAAELRQLRLVLRYHRHATANWRASIITRGRQDSSLVASAAFALLKCTFAVALFVTWRRRAPDGLAALRRRVEDADRQARLSEPSPLVRVIRFFQQVRRPLEWLALLAILDWLLPPEAGNLLEFQLLVVICGWSLTGAFVVSVLHALAGANGPTIPRRSTVDTSSLRLSSLKLVGRVVVMFGLILVITSRVVGQGALYQWVWSTCWLASIPVFLILIRWWRETVFERADLVRKKTAFEQWLLRHRTGLKSFPAAMAGGLYLFLTGSWRAIRNWVGQFAATRRVLAYLFRRELHRLEEKSAPRLEPLPAITFDALGPAHPSPFFIPKEVDTELGAALARLGRARGGILAVVGERGMGKTRLLRHLGQRVENTVSLDLTKERAPDLRRMLNEKLGFAAETSLLEASERLNRRDHGTALLLDGADRLVQPIIGGIRSFDELMAAARENSSRFTWVFALDHVIWQFLLRARGARPLFDEVIQLAGWREESIVQLVKARTEEAGLSPSFEQLLDRLPQNADDIDRQEALARRAASFYRLIWDYAAGNPGVALHIWRSSLGVDSQGRCFVKLFHALDTRDLEMLPDPAVFVLRAVLQLAPASSAAIGRATMLRDIEIADALRYSIARGYVEENAGDFVVSWTWFRALTLFLQRRHLLAPP